MAVISLKLSEALDAQLTEQAQRRRLSNSKLVRRALTAFLQAAERLEPTTAPSAGDLVADLVGCCEGGPADLSSNSPAPALIRRWRCNSSSAAWCSCPLPSRSRSAP
jgi:hypothetical protein